MMLKASKLKPLLTLSGVGNAVGYFNCVRKYTAGCYVYKECNNTLLSCTA